MLRPICEILLRGQNIAKEDLLDIASLYGGDSPDSSYAEDQNPRSRNMSDEVHVPLIACDPNCIAFRLDNELCPHVSGLTVMGNSTAQRELLTLERIQEVYAQLKL